MNFSKEQILQIIDFIINEDNITTGMFALIIDNGISDFYEQIKTSRKIFNLTRSDVDFFYHFFEANYNLILKDNLTIDNMVVPVENEYTFYVSCDVVKYGKENYRYTENLYSEKSIIYNYENGTWDPNDGKLIDEDYDEYELNGWNITDIFISKNITETNEERLKKLLVIKEIVDKKIKELL